MDQDFLDQCTQVANRSFIAEDSARDLFLKLYDLLVFATPTDRKKSVKMLSDVYDLGIDF